MIDKPSKKELKEEKEKKDKLEKAIKEYKFQKGEADLMLKFAEEYEKREDARLHEVESKATVFIGTFSVAVTILLSLLKDFLPGSSSSPLGKTPIWFATIIFLLLALSIFYLCFAIIHSVKTLQRNTFSVLGVRETLNAGSYASIMFDAGKGIRQEPVNSKEQEIIRKKFLYTYRNETVINRKVEQMTLAQSFFVHAVVVFLIMLALLIGYMLWNKAGATIVVWWNAFINLLTSQSGGSSNAPPNTP